MHYSIADIARCITEDPDVWLDGDLLTEAKSETYLSYFNKSLVQVRQADGKSVPLKDLGPEVRINIIQQIQEIVDPALVKYEQYFVRQVASGFLPIAKIAEDGGRLNETLRKFIKYSRKATWDGSKSILEYPDWRKLETSVNEYEKKDIEYDEPGEQRVIYKKSYINNVMSLLLGGPPEIYTYWLREVTSREEACKYGSGTSWCTAIDMGATHHDRYKYNQFHEYHPRGGLYIIELQAPNGKRRPIFQVSSDQAMDPYDVPIARFGPRLANFLRDALDKVADNIHPNTVKTMQKLASGQDLDYVEEDVNVNDTDEDEEEFEDEDED